MTEYGGKFNNNNNKVKYYNRSEIKDNSNKQYVVFIILRNSIMMF